jgi:hypothetical protein
MRERSVPRRLTLAGRKLGFGAGVTLLIVGCGSSSSKRELPSADHLPVVKAARAPTKPGERVSIKAPSDGAVVPTRFTVRVALAGFTLERRESGPGSAKPGRGELEFALDEGRFDEPQYAGRNGQLALRLGVNGYYSPAFSPQITYSGIPTGRHAITVRLADGTGTPTDVSDTVRFVVR